MSHVPPAQPLHPRRVPFEQINHQSGPSTLLGSQGQSSPRPRRVQSSAHPFDPIYRRLERAASLRRPHPSHLLEFWYCPQSPTPTGAARGGSFAIRRGSSSLVFRLESPAPAAEFRGRSRGHAREENGLIRAAVHGVVRSVSPSTQPTWLNFALKPVWRRCGSCERRWTASGKCSLREGLWY